MFSALVVEDDLSTSLLMDAVLKENGYRTCLAKNGMEALDILDSRHIDVIITDIMMPVLNGYSFVEQLRDSGCELPVLAVTAKNALDDKRKGFLVGLDDWMAKPVDEEEMMLRLGALLRRARIFSERKISIGKVTLHYDSLTVSRGGERATLPKKEFYVLYKLLAYPDRIFTRFELMEEIWGSDAKSDERTVIVHINRLRERFATYREFEIVTVRGLGYKAVKRE
jgi:DNA-binding response OmpR family regulator